MEKSIICGDGVSMETTIEGLHRLAQETNAGRVQCIMTYADGSQVTITYKVPK